MTESEMRITSALRMLALAGAAFFAAAPSAAVAEDMKIQLCYAGIVDLLSFPEHVKKLRGMTRYPKEYVDGLVAQQHKGGPSFFSLQVIVQEEPSGSGTFDLRMVHGLRDAKHYTNVAWTCEAKDYPIVYFVGFRVRKIADGTIYVSRKKTTVNVISLKAIDPELNKKIKVKIFEGGKVLCDDIGSGCAQEIFYERG